MVNWKKNLVVIWISQFLSIMGFTFAIPFAPFYMQELGVTDPGELKIWVALFAAAAPFSLAICSPLWGIVADRYGRRIMLLRANFGAAVFLALMGWVDSVGMLIAIRLLQGVLTGTMTAAQTMVAVDTPPHRSGFALGTLASGVYSGAMAGFALGGLSADIYGYRPAFIIASGLLLLAGLMVLFGAKEKFTRPDAAELSTWRRLGFEVTKLRVVFWVLLLIAITALVRRFDTPYVPLLVQDIHGGMVAGSSSRTGLVLGVSAVAGFLSGPALGHLSDRYEPAAVAKYAAIAGGLLMLPQAFIDSLGILVLIRLAIALCVGGLEPIFQAWIARTSPGKDHGLVFGWITTSRSLGGIVAPLASGGTALALGLRPVFAVGACLTVVLGIGIPALMKKAHLSSASAATLT